MKTPKLVVSDVDGTLFGKKDAVTQGLKRLKELIKRYNVPFTLASGRCYSDLKDLINYLDIKLPVIVNNGTGVITEKKVYWSETISPKKIIKAVEYADSCGMLISICNATDEKMVRHNAYVQSYIDRFDKKYNYLFGKEEMIDERRWNDLDIQKLLVIDPEKPGRIDQVIEKIDKDARLSIVRYDDRSIDVMPEGCSKKTGVEKVALLLGISLDEIAAIGDNENDIQMMQTVGKTYCVKNATENLKKVVDVICEYEEAAGVAEMVEKLFGGGENNEETEGT